VKKTLAFMGALLSSLTVLGTVSPQKAEAYSVCGVQEPEATYKTESYLVTICLGEASYQMVLTFHDGTGYKRVPAERQGQGFRGTDLNNINNYLVDSQRFILGTDGEPPVREQVLESNNRQ
jgi:hypothetical protein